MTKVMACWRYNTRNTGDTYSGWYLYFPRQVSEFGVTPKGRDYSKFERNDVVVMGGGLGLSGRPWLDWLRRNGRNKMIGWGLGSNHGKRNPAHWLYFTQREWWPGYAHWAPCPSCMHPLFDLYVGEHANPPEPEHDVVFYVNTLHSPMKGAPNLLGNDTPDLSDILAHLWSGRLVVTSSYHGMYWASLLGKPVVAVTYREKMLNTPWQAGYVSTWKNWQSDVDSAKSWANALSTCRSRTLEVASDISGVIKNWDYDEK